MKTIPHRPAIFMLEDGRIFYGKAAGAIGTTVGKAVFHTGMTGHQQILIDPANQDLILVMATTHIGNTGINQNQAQSERIYPAGIVVKSFSEFDKRSENEISLQAFLESQQKVAIRDIDTRAVVRHLRDHGSMMAVISSEETDVEILKEKLNREIASKKEPASQVSSDFKMGNSNAVIQIAVLNLGVKKTFISQWADKNCYVSAYSKETLEKEFNTIHADGYIISHGAGNPDKMNDAIELVKQIINTEKPVFGIGLGMTLLACTKGIPAVEDKFAHHGLNHSVKNLLTQKAEVTSQSFCYKPEDSALRGHNEIEVTHENINNDTVVGIRFKNKPVFGVLYNPESQPGPHDTMYHFDQFIQKIQQTKKVITT